MNRERFARFLRRRADRLDPLAPVAVGATDDIWTVVERVGAAMAAAGITLSVSVLPEVKQPPPGSIPITSKTTRKRTKAAAAMGCQSCGRAVGTDHALHCELSGLVLVRQTEAAPKAKA